MLSYLKSKISTYCVIFLIWLTSITTVGAQEKSLSSILALQTPVIHLSFDDGTGSNMALDTSVNMNDGVLTNMDPLTDWVTGVAGLAIDTDGINDYVSVADDDSLDFGSDNFSVSFWFNKRTDTSPYSNGVSKWNNGSSAGTNEWLISPATGFNPQFNNVTFVIEIGTSSYGVIDPNVFELNTWHHVVGVRSRTNLFLYRDGKLVASINTVPVNGAINNVGLELRIASNQVQVPTFPTDGKFDDLQIYRFAASDGNVAVGEVASGQIAYLFNNPGLELPVTELIFSNSFEGN